MGDQWNDNSECGRNSAPRRTALLPRLVLDPENAICGIFVVNSPLNIRLIARAGGTVLSTCAILFFSSPRGRDHHRLWYLSSQDGVQTHLRRFRVLYTLSRLQVSR